MYFFRLCSNFSYQALVTASGLSPCLSPTPPQKSLRCQAFFPCVLVNCITLARVLIFHYSQMPHDAFLLVVNTYKTDFYFVLHHISLAGQDIWKGGPVHLSDALPPWLLKRITLSRCLSITKLVLKNSLLSGQGLMVRTLTRNKLHLLF